MGRITDYTGIIATGIAALAVTVNMAAAEQSAERRVADYMRQHYRGRILPIQIESIDGRQITADFIFREVYGEKGEPRDVLMVAQPISGEHAAKHNVDVPSGQLGMTNDEPQNELDGIVNTAYVNSRSRRVFMVLDLTNEAVRKYIKLAYDNTIKQASAWLMKRDAIKA